jgi:peptidoglycan glycosyltransferase
MRHIAFISTILAAIALLTYGLFLPVSEDQRWIGVVWIIGPLLYVAARLGLPRQGHGMGRSVQNLGIVICIGFVMLSLQLLRQQFVSANSYASYVYVDEQTGQTTSNARTVYRSWEIMRGKILDRNGNVLVDSKVVSNGDVIRNYPLSERWNPNAFSNLVGFFSHRFGTSGLEASFDEYLSGEKDSYSLIQTTLLGEQQIGDDLHLTIDADLQNAAMNILGDRRGSIIVLEPKTGAILAMASNPGFDPRELVLDRTLGSTAENERIDTYWRSINSDGAGQPLLNRATQGRYAPGSIFKTLTAIAALTYPNEAKPDDIRCMNELQTEVGAPPVVNAVPDLYLRTGDPSDLERVYAFSCNVAFAQYGLRLGSDLFIEVARKFDIFRPSEVSGNYNAFTDLPTLPSLLYREPGFLNRATALADTSYGQGQLQVTPLQMAMMTAAVANGGTLVEPYLVERVTRPDGSSVLTQGRNVIRTAMSEQVAAKVREDMRAVVEYGFGQPAQQIDRNIAIVGGKSGTAENPAGAPHAWFIAIAPYDKPRFAVVAMIENGNEGSSVGALAAGQAMAAAFEFVK